MSWRVKLERKWLLYAVGKLIDSIEAHAVRNYQFENAADSSRAARVAEKTLLRVLGKME